MSGPPKDELIDTLRSLRSEIVDSRNLTIKTDNLIKNLSADVRQIGKRQEKYEKRYVFNSVASYVMFSVLIFVGLYMAFRAQVDREREAVVAAKVRIGDLQDRVLELEGELERRRDAEEQAYSLVRLMEEDKRDEVLSIFPTVRGKIVNRGEVELLRREVERINSEQALNAFKQGRDFYQSRKYEAARDAFFKSLTHLEKAHFSPELHFLLGQSLFRLKDYNGVVKHMRAALRYSQNKSVRNDTVYQLAVALDRLKRKGEARRAYEEYVKRYAFDKRAPLAQKRVLSFIREGIKAEGQLTGHSSTP